jgi:hypothetical protein
MRNEKNPRFETLAKRCGTSGLTWACRCWIRPRQSPGGDPTAPPTTLGLCARVTAKGTTAKPLDGVVLTLR